MTDNEYFTRIDSAFESAQDYVSTDSFRKAVKSMLITKEDIERFMPNSADDPRFVVISGHLLIEKLFYEFVRSNLARPAMIDGKETNYRQLIALARAMQPKELINPWMYKAMKLLANLRDSYAHNLSPQEGLKNANTFIELVKTNNRLPEVDIEGRYSELASAIISLSLVVAGLLQSDKFVADE